MLESKFQSDFVKAVKERFPQMMVIKNDAASLNGFPDYAFFYGKAWALIEFKKDKHASFRPNQKEYIQLANQMSFARVAYPENADIVFSELCDFFNANSGACASHPFEDPFKHLSSLAQELKRSVS